MIRLLVTDIDGVLTDGRIYVGMTERAMKSLSFQDFDTLSDLRYNGIEFGIITGEDDEFTDYVRNKFAPRYMYTGCKNKLETIKRIAENGAYGLDEIAYIGDGKYDIEVLKKVGMSFAPADAIAEAKRTARIVLENCGGEGCLKEAFDHVVEYNRRESSDQPVICNSSIVDSVLEEHEKLVSTLRESEEVKASIQESIKVILEAFSNGGQLLICGNGGSAADAQHIATEFVSRFYLERKALNSEALSVNTSSLTAIANDYDYDRVFSRQIEAKGKAGDVLIGISTSGSSKNVIKAFDSAKSLGMRTIAFVGDNKMFASNHADIVVSVPSDCTPRIQEMHIMIGHIICEEVERRLFV